MANSLNTAQETGKIVHQETLSQIPILISVTKLSPTIQGNSSTQSTSEEKVSVPKKYCGGDLINTLSSDMEAMGPHQQQQSRQVGILLIEQINILFTNITKTYFSSKSISNSKLRVGTSSDSKHSVLVKSLSHNIFPHRDEDSEPSKVDYSTNAR